MCIAAVRSAILAGILWTSAPRLYSVRTSQLDHGSGKNVQCRRASRESNAINAKGRVIVGSDKSERRLSPRHSRAVHHTSQRSARRHPRATTPMSCRLVMPLTTRMSRLSPADGRGRRTSKDDGVSFIILTLPSNLKVPGGALRLLGFDDAKKGGRGERETLGKVGEGGTCLAGGPCP